MEIPPEVHDRISASLPDVSDLHKRVYDLQGEMLPESSAHVAIACVCLQNAVELFQDAAAATYDARWEWHRFQDHEITDYPNKGRYLLAVNASRVHFDHAANCLYAGMNHLAGSMWHFHEGVEGPLGGDYKSADQIRKHWEKHGATHPSLPILQDALSNPAWVVVAGYRNRWNHREYPLIEGELRNRREEVWKDAGEPPPPHYLMAHVNETTGRVAYLTSGIGSHEYRMPDLMDAATAAVHAAATAVEAFRLLVERYFVEAFAAEGITYGPV